MRNAPARKGEGVEVGPGSHFDPYSTADARRQYLGARFGLSFARASLIAPLVFGEAGHG